MIVYHYTPIDTLEKILAAFDSSEQSHLTLRGTHCVYLNDSTENVLGVVLVKRYIKQIEDEFDVSDDKRLMHVAQVPESYLAKLLRTYDCHGIGFERFVISFSQDQDNLVMWSMYGNKGNGLALGFDTDHLTDQLTFNHYVNIEQGFCTYLGINQLLEATPESLPETYKAIKERYQELTRPEVMDSMKKVYQVDEATNGRMLMQQDLLMNLIQYASIFYKQDCWNNEREYRLSFETIGGNIQYHKNQTGDYIPHSDIPVPVAALKNITIGPATRKNAFGYVRSLLMQHNIQQCELMESRVPLM